MMEQNQRAGEKQLSNFLDERSTMLMVNQEFACIL